jgi:hypothetical protein
VLWTTLIGLCVQTPGRGGRQRPQEALSAVARRMSHIRRHATTPAGDAEQHLVRRIGDRMRGLGKQGGRTGQHATRQLRRGHGQVCGERSELRVCRSRARRCGTMLWIRGAEAASTRPGLCLDPSSGRGLAVPRLHHSARQSGNSIVRHTAIDGRRGTDNDARGSWAAALGGCTPCSRHSSTSRQGSAPTAFAIVHRSSMRLSEPLPGPEVLPGQSPHKVRVAMQRARARRTGVGTLAGGIASASAGYTCAYS